MSENTERTMAPAVPPRAAPAQRTARQRRPTGAPPPLPHPFRVTTTAWLLLAVAIVTCAFLFSQHTAWLRIDDQANTWLLRRLADVRTPWLTDLASGIKEAGSSWGVTGVGLSVVALTMIFRRWRHLLVFVGSLFFLVIVGQWIYLALSRPRPYGVSIIDSWGGYVSYQLDFAPGASPLLAPGVRSAVAFMPRVTLVDHVRDQERLALCGRGAACPG